MCMVKVIVDEIDELPQERIATCLNLWASLSVGTTVTLCYLYFFLTATTLRERGGGRMREREREL